MRRALLLVAALCLAQCVLGTFPLKSKLLAPRIVVSSMNKRAAVDYCPKYACESGSGACGMTGTDMMKVCTADHKFCNITDVSLMTGTCTSAQANGASCTSNDECMSDYCYLSVCTATPDTYRMNGEACTTSSQCYSNICTSSTCQAIPSGSSCTYDDQCAFEYYCSSGSRVCTAKVAAGADCSGNPGACQGLMICSAANSQCILPFTASQGTECQVGEECVEGTTCVMSTSGSATCMSVASSTYAACQVDGDCSNLEKCQCNANKGEMECVNSYMNNPTGEGLAGKAKNLNACAMKCTGNTNMDQCTDMCKGSYCSLENAVVGPLMDEVKRMYPSCMWGMMGDSECNGASTIVLSVAAVAAAVFACIM